MEEAWRPTVVTLRGQTIAFLGCTGVVGVENPITYVASEQKGGAAHCEDRAIERAVSDARSRHDLVVFMVHDGYEYVREPVESVRRMTAIARNAGATLVINHHPHVVGSLDWDGSSLVAWSLAAAGTSAYPPAGLSHDSAINSRHHRDPGTVAAYADLPGVCGVSPMSRPGWDWHLYRPGRINARQAGAAPRRGIVVLPRAGTRVAMAAGQDGPRPCP